MQIPRVVVAGTASGVGKTSVTCAIIHGLRRRGYSVQPFKAGPDYIDPSFLSAVSGNASGNLDAWLMGESLVENFVGNSTSDISVIEGVMGYYDGFSGGSDFASTFDVATRLESPSILVIDASKAARSVAAVAYGFAGFSRNSRIGGVILNRVGSKKHESMCREALEPLGIPLLGAIPRGESQPLASRHLGLVPASERREQADSIREVAGRFSEYIDIEGIVSICESAKPLGDASPPAALPKRAVLAVALDSSFNFYYRENLDALRRQGADITFFSPLSDERPPRCDGLYIGGGFPEVMGPQLAENRSMAESVKGLAQDGAPVYAECGGLMYLTDSIRYGERRHGMVGLVPAETEMTGRMTLNYTEGEAVLDSVVAGRGSAVRAHEFHYSRIRSVPADTRFAYRLSTGQGIADGRDGVAVYNTLASYCHMYLTGGRAKRLVDACAVYSRR